MKAHSVDVAILGGGWAGNLLARQLRRQQPGLSVLLVEKTTERGWKVGESVTELGSSYLLRRQGLSRYLYDHHYPKNGLRYFFDSAERDLALSEMSEIGPINLPFHPGFQLDRARIESDLLAMNRADGVRVMEGSRVRHIEVGSASQGHRIEVATGSELLTVGARWLVDASGRSELLARQLGLRTRETEHRIGAVWARFEGVADIDDMGPADFHARVRWSTRALSTIHFWYPGYWVWFIPLRGGVTSVGWVGHGATNDPALRTQEGFLRRLREHRAIGSLLRDAKPLDQGAFRQIAYGTRRFFDAPARFALSGEAASATDPLYSPGTDFIALENDFICDLIARETAGEAASDLAERCELYDRFMQFRQEATLRLYRGLYDALGSYELMRLKWDFDLASYYNLWLSAFLQDQHLDLRWLSRQLRMKDFVLQALDQFAELFRAVAAHLRREGRYFSENRGRFSPGLELLDFAPRIGERRSRREVLDQTARIFNHVHREALVLLGDGDARQRPARPLQAFLAAQPLV